jgi:hypothetical protein
MPHLRMQRYTLLGIFFMTLVSYYIKSIITLIITNNYYAK